MTLLVIHVNGATERCERSYEAIKVAMNQATITMVGAADRRHALYIDDNGILERQPLNVVASILAGMALYGTAVLTGPADDEGGDTDPDESIVDMSASIGDFWLHVVLDAQRKGQRPFPLADPDTLPPAEIIPMTNEEFERWLAER